MPTATVTRSIALAKRMIEKEGGLCTLTRVVEGTTNHATQTRAGDVEQSVSVKMVQKPYTPLTGVGQGRSLAPQTAILVDGASFLMLASGLPWEPRAGMKITSAGGIAYTVVTTITNAPDGTPVVYTCACSRN